MENYTRGKCVEEPLEKNRVPIDSLPETFLWMKVKPNSKLRNLLGLATNSFKDERVVLWTGSGPAIIKAISCAEIMKRKFKNLHQITRLCFRKVEEIWKPVTDGLDELVVEREIPTIHILLSKDSLDNSALGYQAPGDSNNFGGRGEVQREKKYVHFNRGKNYQPRQRKKTAIAKEEESQSGTLANVPERQTGQQEGMNQKRKRISENETNNDSLKK